MKWIKGSFKIFMKFYEEKGVTREFTWVIIRFLYPSPMKVRGIVDPETLIELFQTFFDIEIKTERLITQKPLSFDCKVKPKKIIIPEKLRMEEESIYGHIIGSLSLNNHVINLKKVRELLNTID